MEPSWVKRLLIGRWVRISGDHPDLDLPPTPPGTRYLEDNDTRGRPCAQPRARRQGTIAALARQASPFTVAGPQRFSLHNRSLETARCWRHGSASRVRWWYSAVATTTTSGADMHAFDLDSRQWSRIADGYISAHDGAYGAGAVYPDAEYPDGSPLPPHTDGYVQYDPAGNDYILFKGQLELGPAVQAVAIPHIFNFDSLAWRRGPRHPAAILNSGGWTTWDEKRGVLWGHCGDAGGGNAFLCFDPRGDNADGTFGRWGKMFPNKLPGEADHNAVAIDPACEIIVVAAHGRDALCAIDPARPERPLKPLNSSAGQPRLREYAALEYAPNLRAFVYFSAGSGAAMHTVTPPSGSSWTDLTEGTWNWRPLLGEKNTLDPVAEASGESAYETSVTHTFGRFRIATYAGVDVAILVRHIDSPVYAMRLT